MEKIRIDNGPLQNNQFQDVYAISLLPMIRDSIASASSRLHVYRHEAFKELVTINLTKSLNEMLEGKLIERYHLSVECNDVFGEYSTGLKLDIKPDLKFRLNYDDIYSIRYVMQFDKSNGTLSVSNLT